MPKSNYLALFAQLETTTDPVQRQALIDQLYDFSPPSPLPEGETIEDYLLTDNEIEKFAYVEDDYVEPNPGTIIESDNLLFVTPGYVLEGYINIESSVIPGYLVGDYSAYVGVYYNDLGEST